MCADPTDDVHFLKNGPGSCIDSGEIYSSCCCPGLFIPVGCWNLKRVNLELLIKIQELLRPSRPLLSCVHWRRKEGQGGLDPPGF